MYEQITANKFKTALLMSAFVLFVLVVGYVFGRAFNWGYFGLVIALLVVFVGTWGSYWYSDRIVLAAARARPAEHEREPYIVNTVEGLAIAAGLPKPSVWIVEDAAPNAFATGRNPEHAAIAVTTGLVEKLDRLELEGVIAHELSHIKNYDTLVTTLAAVMAGSVTLASEWMLRSMWWGGGRRRNSNDGGAGALFALIGVALALLSPLVALLLQMAISRKREFLADANGAMFTRYPDGLASALRKIAADTDPLDTANKATASLWIYNPLKDYGGPVNSLFNTHPPIDERIRRLEAM